MRFGAVSVSRQFAPFPVVAGAAFRLATASGREGAAAPLKEEPVPGGLDRRRLLTAAGAVVLAFDPVGRAWVTTADAAEGLPAGALRVPRLDGELTTDPAALAEAADDYGHIVSRTPVAVLRPGSVRDVVAIVRYANRHGLQVAMRGQGHSTFGQAQVDGGVVIDSRTLAEIHAITGDRAVVDAGVLWSTLTRAALAHGLTPAVLQDYLELSVGGSLGVGGIGGATQRYGLQVDNVLELEVVTGEGRLVRCSPTRSRLLFESVLGGLGQYGILVRATVALVPAPTSARVYELFYADLGAYLADQAWLVEQQRFGFHEGQVVERADGAGWEYKIEVAAYTQPGEVPDDTALLAGLSPLPGRTIVTDHTYLDWLDRLAPTVAFLIEIGVWFFPHPWINLFLPAGTAQEVVSGALAQLTPERNADAPILLYPLRTALLERPLVRVPDEPIAFLFAILRTAPPDPAVVGALVGENRALYEAARDAGGYRYPVGSVPFTRADWRQHYGPTWPRVLAAKQRFDPHHVLTPGQAIFD